MSWGRNEVEMKEKLEHWGHSHDFDTDSYYDFWKSITLENYSSIRMYHPLGIRHCWTSLSLMCLAVFGLSQQLLNEIIQF